MKKIVLFGDSNIAQTTVGIPVANRWYSLLSNNYNIINNAVPGASSEDLRSQFKTRVLDHEPDEVIIGFGGNDSYLQSSATTPKVTRARFEENLIYFVRTAQDAGIKVTLFTSAPVIESILYNRWSQSVGTDVRPWYNYHGGVQNFRNLYNNITRNVANLLNATLVDIYNLTISQYGPSESALLSSGLIQSDGNHWSASGASWVAQCCRDYIKIGYRLSLNKTSFSVGETMILYLVAGDANSGVIDNYPFVGASVSCRLMKDNGSAFTRYKTINATTSSNGRISIAENITSAYPKGTYRVFVDITVNGKISRHSSKFSII